MVDQGIQFHNYNVLPHNECRYELLGRGLRRAVLEAKSRSKVDNIMVTKLVVAIAVLQTC